jgi:apolipoprotein N-acyltransferase
VASTVKIPAARVSGAPGVFLPMLILLGLVSAVLLDFCFPVAGPMPPWRAGLAWIALVPLLWALLNERAVAHPRYIRRAALTAYLCGVLWYILNCYWIYQTMLYYGGGIPPIGCAGIVVLFSAVLGLYFGLFGWITAVFRRRYGLLPALALAPFVWAALDLAAARITSVPWDQLGYSQINNLLLTRLAPWTGVYGITWVLILGNAALTRALLCRTLRAFVPALIAVVLLSGLIAVNPAPSPTSAYAVLLQPNINVAANTSWEGQQWQGNPNWLLQQSTLPCTPAYAGEPQAGEQPATPANCAQNTPAPGVVIWPEVASWFRSDNRETIDLLHALATTAHAPVIAGMVGADPTGIYNSAVFTDANGVVAGRYDKIHLVPFGEYVPYREVFFFAHHLTSQVGDFNRGTRRNVFSADGHSFGTFICYESVFADEVRQFAKNGAQVLVNISDDGWYGDTSAPWQHLDMTRMRAIENDRWLLLDTNNGVTAAIDPHGRVTESAPRHQLTTLVARYGYRTDLTFYTRYGDVFGWLCAAVVVVALGMSVGRRRVAGSR